MFLVQAEVSGLLVRVESASDQVAQQRSSGGAANCSVLPAVGDVRLHVPKIKHSHFRISVGGRSLWHAENIYRQRKANLRPKSHWTNQCKKLYNISLQWFPDWINHLHLNPCVVHRLCSVGKCNHMKQLLHILRATFLMANDQVFVRPFNILLDFYLNDTPYIKVIIWRIHQICDGRLWIYRRGWPMCQTSVTSLVDGYI